MTTVHQLKLTLADVVPAVWRRVQVRSEATLARLHQVLQAAMGWEKYHLYVFDIGPDRYGPMDTRADTVTLAEVLPAAGATMVYRYVSGDQWRHLVVVETVLTRPEPGAIYPRCTAGARACPPEDVGGPPGYAAMLRALRARRGHHYHEIRDWLGTHRFDAEAFDLAAANARLDAAGRTQD